MSEESFNLFKIWEKTDKEITEGAIDNREQLLEDSENIIKLSKNPTFNKKDIDYVDMMYVQLNGAQKNYEKKQPYGKYPKLIDIAFAKIKKSVFDFLFDYKGKMALSYWIDQVHSHLKTLIQTKQKLNSCLSIEENKK